MATCCICGADCFWTAARIRKADAWICSDCIAKMGGFGHLPTKAVSVEEIKEYYSNRIIQISEGQNQLQLHLTNIGYKNFEATNKIGDFFWYNVTTKQWLCPATVKNGLYKGGTIYNYDDIVSYELIENGTAITSGGVSSAITGGILFGSTGAVVGGITGSKKTNTLCSSLDIKITLNDIQNPVQYIKFLSSPVKKNSIAYQKCFEATQETLSVLQLICKENELNHSSHTSQFSVADEIRKYKLLLDDGIITQEEFDAKKKQLLNL